MRFPKYSLAALVAITLTLAPIAMASEVVQERALATDRATVLRTIDGAVEYNDAAVASDGVNFLAVWVEGADRLLQAMVIGPRGNVLVPPHRLSTGMAHARPALAWTGEAYLLVSIDMQVPRRLVAHQITTRGQLAGTPPVVIAQEARSFLFPEDSVVLMVASPRAVFVWWESVSIGPPGTSSGLGTGLATLDRSGSVLKTAPNSLGGMKSIAIDGSTIFLGQQRGGGCMYPECVGDYGVLLKLPQSSAAATYTTGNEMIETSLASSPAGVLYIDTTLGRKPRLVRGNVEQTAEAIFPAAAQRSAWTGGAFLTTWLQPLPREEAVQFGELRLVGSYITPRRQAAPAVTRPFTIGYLPLAGSRIMAMAGSNSGTALILVHNRNNSVAWTTVTQTRPRERAARR
jgi:hypothetical protein